MTCAEEHQQRAAECMRLAQSAVDPTNKALLLEMAQCWARLAGQTQARAKELVLIRDSA